MHLSDVSNASNILEHLSLASAPAPSNIPEAAQYSFPHAPYAASCCWRSMPPSATTGLMSIGHLREVLGHLPMDARHWNQLEQLLEEGRLETFLVMVYNYLRYEDPTKWNKLEKEVRNPAGYLNKNIGQKIGMLSICQSMVACMHELRMVTPETAENIDGRTLQYMFDNLEQDQVKDCCAFLMTAFDNNWSTRCENPRMLLHAKVKTFVGSVQAERGGNLLLMPQTEEARYYGAAIGHFSMPAQQQQRQQQQHQEEFYSSMSQPMIHS